MAAKKAVMQLLKIKNIKIQNKILLNIKIQNKILYNFIADKK